MEAKDLRDPSSPAAPRNDRPDGFLRHPPRSSWFGARVSSLYVAEISIDIPERSRIIIFMAEKRKNPYAVALGRRGGKKGGPARAANMTPDERSESARNAVLARWAKAKANERRADNES